MRSKTWFYNAGIGRNMLRRYWPVWAGYFAFVLLTLSTTVSNTRWMDADRIVYRLLSSGRSMALYGSFFIAVLAALVVFSFLYSTRSCGMITSLPVKRETVFITAYLTGLVPLMLADVLAVLLVTPFALSIDGITWSHMLQWLAMVIMGNIVFYGIAVFCAMLTGSIIVMPVVYGMLNLAAYIVELCVLNLMRVFVYGFVTASGELGLVWLSPIVALSESFRTIYWSEPGVVSGWGVLALYCAVGLLLSAAALWLYRRRDMERATDTVAIPELKPVFRYCMAVGTALVFAIVIYYWFFDYSDIKGLTAAGIIALLVAAGAAIGWFAAEMLIQKTVKVFKGRWKGCVAICLFMAALTMAMEFDLFGVERAVPKAENVAEVVLNYRTIYRQPENIEKILDLHRQILSHKTQNESAENTRDACDVCIKYVLKNGKTIVREFPVEDTVEANRDPASDLRVTESILNTREGILDRSVLHNTDIELIPEHLVYVRLYLSGADPREDHSYYIPADEAFSFVTDCLLPDIADGTMGRERIAIQSDERYDLGTLWSVEVYLEKRLPDGPDGEYRATSTSGRYVLQMDAARCMAWIRANTDLDIQPLRVTEN